MTAERQAMADIVDDLSDPRDVLRLQVSDVHVDLLTGIYSDETHLPQRLRITVLADMAAPCRFTPDTPLSASKNYLDLKRAITDAMPRDRHFTLVEAIADHIADTLFVQDARVRRVEVRIVKLAISTDGEEIGITMIRHRA